MAPKFKDSQSTAVRLMMNHPYFMGPYYTMALYELPKDWPIPFRTLATNGVSIWIDPDFWNALTRNQKMTAIAHELGHKMYCHVSRIGQRNPFAWNIAGDHRINLDLTKSGFEPLICKIGNESFNWCCDPKYNTPTPWTTEAIYDDIINKAQKEGKNWKTIVEGWAKNLRDIVEFGKDPTGQKDPTIKESSKIFETRVQQELKEMAESAKQAGNVPAWLEGSIYNVDHVKVNWWEVVEDILRGIYSKEYAWNRFNKRELVKADIISPDMYSPSFGGVLLYIDCTGSCWDKLSTFNMHFKDIIQTLKPDWTEVRYFQTNVMPDLTQRFGKGEVDVDIKPKGGGGTCFQWLSDDVESMEEKPEVIFFLSDLEGDFGRPVTDIPIYFLSVSSITKTPFGEVISIQ